MTDNLPPPATPLQFDTAEYSTSQTTTAACAVCKGPLTQSYYTANAKVICERCRGQLTAYLAGGSPLKRALAATALGLLAALAGAAVWYAVRKVTGYELGIIAIAVGLMVGVAVRKGSAGRGGWFYQVLAIALTYISVSAQYVPDLVEAAAQGFHKRHAVAAGQAANPAASERNDKAAAKNDPAENAAAEDADTEKAPPGDATKPQPGMLATAFAVAYFLVVAIGIALALPVMVGMQSPISLLIVGFALYEAWKINKGSSIRMAGPFQLGGPAASGAAGG